MELIVQFSLLYLRVTLQLPHLCRNVPSQSNATILLAATNIDDMLNLLDYRVSMRVVAAIAWVLRVQLGFLEQVLLVQWVLVVLGILLHRMEGRVVLGVLLRRMLDMVALLVLLHRLVVDAVVLGAEMGCPMNFLPAVRRAGKVAVRQVGVD